MDSCNKENEDSSLFSSESNLPQTMPPSKQHKLGVPTTGLWLGGFLDNNNIYFKYVDKAARSNRQCGNWGMYCLHIQQSHSCHAM